MRRLLLPIIVILLLIGGIGIRYYLQHQPDDAPTYTAESIPDQPTETSDILRFASWNIRIFSNDSRDDAELRQICQVLVDYDLIAIVELRDEAVLKRTEATLEGDGRRL